MSKKTYRKKQQQEIVEIELDDDLLYILRKSGRGWQSRLNELLRAAVGLQS